MRIKKLVSAIVSSALAAIIAVSAIPLTASAESNTGNLIVTLLNYTPAADSEVVYPSTVRGDELYDFKLELKSGASYSGVLSGNKVTFSNVDTTDFAGAKITYKTDKSKFDFPEDINLSWSVYNSATEKWSDSEAVIDTFFLKQEWTEESKQQCENINNMTELEAFVPQYTGNYTYTLALSTEPCGFGSVMLAWMPEASNERFENEVYISDRNTYKIPDVMDVKMTVGDTPVPCYYNDDNGILSFSFPSGCEGEIKIRVRGYYDGTDAMYTTEFIIDDVVKGGYYSANNDVYVLGLDSEINFVSEADYAGDEDDPEDNPDNPDKPSDEIDEGDAIIVDPIAPPEEDDASRQAIFNLTSKLGDYDKSLVADFNTWFNICNASDKDKALLADNPSSFGGFDLAKSAKETIKLLAGNYVPSFSDMLIVSGAKPFTINNQDISYNITADAKYSLKITGSGDLDYSINGLDFKTKPDYLFLAEPNIEYVLLDNSTGNVYKATVTKDNPKATIDLTSKTGLIDNINTGTGTGGTTSDYEDVPNTSDNMLLLIFLPLLLLIPIGVVVIITIKKNRKAGGDND